MCTPSRRPAPPSGLFSQITFTRPSVSPRMRARLLPPKGSRFVMVSMPAVERVLLGHAHEGDLGMAVDGPGDLAVVDRKGPFAEDLLDGEDRLGETDMSQLRCRDEIADGEDTRRPGPHPLVHADITALIDLDPGALGQRARRRAGADRWTSGSSRPRASPRPRRPPLCGRLRARAR